MKLLLPIIALLILIMASARAGIEVRDFPNPELRNRYNDLIEELRCLVCQNQSLADSNADLAEDLRDEVYTMLLQGKSNREIVDFLVNRYGDFVLYRPPVNPSTLLLWLGPFLALAVGLIAFWRLARLRRPDQSATLTETEQQRLKDLLNKDD